MANNPSNAAGEGAPQRPGRTVDPVLSSGSMGNGEREGLGFPLWLATACIFFSAGVGTGGWVASIPRICRDFALSTAALGTGLPAIAGGSLIATVFVPLVVKRIGAARASIFCAILFMFSVVGPTLSGGFPILILPFLALGITCGATEICMNAYASAAEQTRGRPVMSSFHASQTVGMLVGVGLGGAIAGLGGSTTSGAIGAAALMGMSLIIATIIMWQRNQFRQVPEAPAAAKVARDASLAPAVSAASSSPPTAVIARMRSFMTLPKIPAAVLVLGITLGIASLMQNGVADWGGVYCVRVLQLSDALAGSGFSCLLVAIVFSRLVGDSLVARLGPIVIIQCGAVLVAVGYVTVWLAPSVLVACLGFIVVGLGLGNLNPVIFGLLGRASSHPAKAISMGMAINYLCAMAGPVLIGFLAECYGLRQAFLGLVVAAMLVATVLATLIKRTGVARSGP